RRAELGRPERGAAAPASSSARAGEEGRGRSAAGQRGEVERRRREPRPRGALPEGRPGVAGGRRGAGAGSVPVPRPLAVPRLGAARRGARAEPVARLRSVREARWAMTRARTTLALALLFLAVPALAEKGERPEGAPGTVSLPLAEYDRLVDRAAHPPSP